MSSTSPVTSANNMGPGSPSHYQQQRAALEAVFQQTYDAAIRALPEGDETHVLREPPLSASHVPRVKIFCSSTKAAPPRPGADLEAPLMQMSPTEREIGRTSRSGRTLSELEVLQEKHELEFRRVVPVVGQALKDVVAQHESLIRSGAQRDDKYATYETNAVPTIRIDDYVQRISEYTYISPATLIGTLIVLDRLSQKHPTLLFTMLNVYKIFFVAVRIASKVVDLRTLNNKNFSSVGGISNRHLNEVEARMLSDLRFDLYIHPNEIVSYTQRAFASFPGFVPRGMPSAGIAHLYHVCMFQMQPQLSPYVSPTTRAAVGGTGSTTSFINGGGVLPSVSQPSSSSVAAGSKVMGSSTSNSRPASSLIDQQHFSSGNNLSAVRENPLGATRNVAPPPPRRPSYSTPTGGL